MVLSPFLFSYDDKMACQMILDKKGLKGYQVIQVFMFNFSSLTMLFFGCLTWFYYLIGILYAFSLSLYIIIIHCNVNWQIGKAKVFLRAGQMAELDARRAEVIGNAARTIQRQILTYIARKEFTSLRKAAIQTQSHWQGIVFYCLQISALCQ